MADSNQDAGSKEALEVLHDLVAAELSRSIREGIVVVDDDGVAYRNPVDAARLNVALNFLKHNGIACKPTRSNPTGALVASLPFAGMEARDADGNPLPH